MSKLPVSFAAFQDSARRRLPKILYNYIEGGSFDEITLRRNAADFDAIGVRQRVLRDVSTVSTSTTLFGKELAMPLALSPVGLAGMFARRGEVQAFRAAAAADIGFTLSTMSICSVEEIAASGTVPWFQLYMVRDRGYMRELLGRADAAGAEVLVFTVDLPVVGVRRGSTAASQRTPLDQLRLVADGLMHPRWLWDVQLRGGPHLFGNIAAAVPEARSTADFFAWIQKNGDASVRWDDLAWIRSHWRGPIVIKGILDPEDARQAVAIGANGVVVSNHGGRQLDSASSTIAALPGVVEAVEGTLPVLIDGGIRSGMDVFKALALGASGCMIGRAWAYALATGGEAGVAHMIELFRLELRTAMALAGCTSIAGIGREALLQP